MQQVKEPGAGEERRYGVECGEKQISFPACLPALAFSDWEGSKVWGIGCRRGREGERGKRCGGGGGKKREERGTCNGGVRGTRSLKKMIARKEARWAWGEQTGDRWATVEFLPIGSAGCFTKPAPTPTPAPLELWLLFLPANSFLRLLPSVRADSADTQCFQLSNSWQSVHRALK